MLLSITIWPFPVTHFKSKSSLTKLELKRVAAPGVEVEEGAFPVEGKRVSAVVTEDMNAF